jgi:hypothetical protein
MTTGKTLVLACTLILAGVFPAAAEKGACLIGGKLLVKPGDNSYCTCLNSLTGKQIRRLDIDQAEVQWCKKSIVSPLASLTPGDADNGPPPPDNGPPPPDGDDGGDTAKGNNGVGNGVDPPPPGIGNAGNDAEGRVPGSPGGSSTAPGRS